MIQFARADAAQLDRLGDEIAELAAHIHAAAYRLLVCVREFDERGGWKGFRSCAEWLSWRTGIAPGAAREKVRVARALANLPLISEAMRCGEMSFAKARAITRVATATNEQELLEVSRRATAAQVETIVRAWRRCDRLEEREREDVRHDARYLNTYVDEDGAYVVRGRLDPEVGAIFARALEAAVAELRTGTVVDGVRELSGEQRRADAVGLLAELALQQLNESAAAPDARVVKAVDNGNTRRNRRMTRVGHYQVVLHVDAEQAVLDNGARVSAETSERMMCDASRMTMRHGANGEVLDVGRRTRVVPSAIRRALEHRDRGCRFPGCGVRYCDAHHVQHWRHGGATRVDNLVLLCRVHHRMIHEGGFRVARTDSGKFEFYWPNGERLPAVPAAPVVSTDRLHDSDVEITPWTATPEWHGERLDVHWAIAALRR